MTPEQEQAVARVRAGIHCPVNGEIVVYALAAIDFLDALAALDFLVSELETIAEERDHWKWDQSEAGKEVEQRAVVAEERAEAAEARVRELEQRLRHYKQARL